MNHNFLIHSSADGYLGCFYVLTIVNSAAVNTGVHVSHHPEHPSHPPPHPIPLGCPRALALSALLHALNLHWSSILHMVIYMFQCYSLISSHPRLLPESKSLFFTSVSLLLSSIWGHRSHLSKFHIYVLKYNICLSLSDLLPSV